MDKPTRTASTDNLDAAITPDAPADAIETIENDNLVTATGGYWGGPVVYAPAWGPAYRPVYAAPAWGPYAASPYAAWGPRPHHWWR